MFKKLKKWRLLARGFMRCRVYIFCPRCNSDAPAKQFCKICNDFYGCPSRYRRASWWLKFKTYLHGQ